MYRLASILVLVGSPAFADPAITMSPVAIAGPYKSQHDACVHADPCGGTEIDPKDPFKFIKPPKLASCGTDDINGSDSNGKAATSPCKTTATS